MDASKVQLDAVEDFLYVRQQVETALQDLPIPASHAQQLLNLVFGIVKNNVIVNSIEWNNTSLEEIGMEPFDKTLFEDLQKLQNRVDGLLLEVTNLRQEVPTRLGKTLEDNYATKLKEQQQQLQEAVKRCNNEPLPVHSASSSSYEQSKARFEEAISILVNLQKNIPALIERIKKAASIYQRIPEMKSSATEQALMILGITDSAIVPPKKDSVEEEEKNKTKEVAKTPPTKSLSYLKHSNIKEKLRSAGRKPYSRS